MILWVIRRGGLVEGSSAGLVRTSERAFFFFVTGAFRFFVTREDRHPQGFAHRLDRAAATGRVGPVSADEPSAGIVAGRDTAVVAAAAASGVGHPGRHDHQRKDYEQSLHTSPLARLLAV
jgi:hypothetical protein